MKLLTSDQGTICMGILSAASPTSASNAIFYLCGVCFGFSTYYTAAMVYIEAWQSVPDSCKGILKWMIYFYFVGWLMFPILFIVGPEGAFFPFPCFAARPVFQFRRWSPSLPTVYGVANCQKALFGGSVHWWSL